MPGRGVCGPTLTVGKRRSRTTFGECVRRLGAPIVGRTERDDLALWENPASSGTGIARTGTGLRPGKMNNLLAQQLAEARKPNGEIDIDALTALVSAAYDASDRERLETERSMSLMVEELKRAQARLLDTLDLVPEGLVVLDAEDKYVLWNRHYADIYAESHGQISTGMRFEDTVRAGIARGQYPDAIGREEEWLAERLARHGLPQSSFEQQLPNGRWVRIEERRTADGGSIGVRIDITDLKNREESFRILFDANPVPMWVLDLETYKFIAVNDAAVAHYGYSREQFLNMRVHDIKPSDERDDMLMRLQVPGQSRPLDRTWRHIRADGSVMDVRVYRRHLPYDGRQAALVGVIDVTQQKRAEDNLRRTERFLNSIVENVPLALIVKKVEDGTYVLVNREAERLFNVPHGKMIGKTAYDVFERRQADAVSDRDRQVVATRQPIVVEDLPMRTLHDGARVLRSSRAVIVDDTGTPQHIIVITEDTTERKRAQDKIVHLAHHDPLTDLPNRASFNGYFAATLANAARTKQRFAVVCIDLDRFKEVNDVFGHAVGDALLCQVTDRLRTAAGGAFLARPGGDEFTLIVTGEPDVATALGERLLAAMADGFEIDGHHLRMGLSLGVAVFPADGADATTLLGNADAALYRAKSDGRGTIRFFQADMDKRLREKRALQLDLQSAIARNEVTLHFQPVARSDGEVVGLEALARWHHPRRGSIPPGTFVPIAEDSGLIMPMGEWILRQACLEAATWSNPLRIAVNLSPVQFCHGDLPRFVHALLLETGLAADRLELEITEGVLIGDFARAVGILRRLKALGVRIAMDDFGTGYSSMSYLQSFPFDKIKIDRAFVMNVHRNSQSAAIARAIIGLCHGLGLPVAAEGVETEEQRVFLARENCDELQGFLIGYPRPIEDYAVLVGRGGAVPQRPALAVAAR
jgi:diguanylate cyclase (GGDEF)-like protein/PAS domain S-box-containing protein